MAGTVAGTIEGISLALSSGALVAAVAAILRGTYRSGQNDERMRDTERRLDRLEHRVGMWGEDKRRSGR